VKLQSRSKSELAKQQNKSDQRDVNEHKVSEISQKVDEAAALIKQ
jgi:hypothetical protein